MTHIMAPASRSRNSALVRIFMRFLRTVKHRQRVRRSIATLDSFNDRTLADIGLRRDRSNPSQFNPL